MDLSRQSTINVLQSKNLFESLTSDFHTNYKLACNSDTVMDFIMAPEISGNQILETRNFIQNLLENSSLPEEIYIYSFQNKKSVSSRETVTLGDNNYYEWYRTYRSTALSFLMFPRKNAEGIFNKLYICSEIYDGNQRIGLFCIEMNYQQFADLIRTTFVIDPDQIFVVSNIGLILYSDDPALINTDMFGKEDTYTAFRAAKNEEGNFIIYDDTIIAVAKSIPSQLIIMSYIPKSSYLKHNPFILILLVGSLGATLILSLFLALSFSLRHYRSIANVMEILNDPAKLNCSDVLINEFFYIANSISDISQQNAVMSKRNADITTELREKMYLLKSAQIAALQAQINPHFLFNTLQLVNLSIIKEIKRDNTATYLVNQLAALVRASYSTEQYIVPVHEEFRITQLYLNIQKARYQSQLQINIDVQPECLDIKTVKLILQPLVENSILHAFQGREASWQLSILCFVEDNYLIYQVKDNGKGIARSNLDTLNETLMSDKIDRDEKVGIFNVNQRLKLVFGHQCGINISSVPDGGTTITMRHIINSQL